MSLFSFFKYIIKLLKYFPIYIKVYKDPIQINNLCNRWYEILRFKKTKNTKYDFINLFHHVKEFRNVVFYYYNIKKGLLTKLYPGMTNLYIAPKSKIGEGLVIQHGFSTIILCQEMGNNCQVWQNVTIGKAKSGDDSLPPIIGDNVKIGANSVVIGNIKIGNNAFIGAGCVVRSDIPDNAIVIGNPAKIVKIQENSSNEN